MRLQLEAATVTCSACAGEGHAAGVAALLGEAVGQFRCAVCLAVFSSRNQLFTHIKENPRHAVAKGATQAEAEPEERGGAGGGKKGRKKGRRRGNDSDDG